MVHPFTALRRIENMDLWETEFYIDVFGSLGKLVVCADESGPSQRQREVFDRFIEAQGSLHAKIYDAIFAYYLGVVDDCQARFSPENLHMAPRITTADEVKALLRDPYLIHMDDIRQEEVGLLSECIWEPEHGLGVRVLDRDVIEVGFQDICL
jgi:hypothetical protein